MVIPYSLHNYLEEEIFPLYEHFDAAHRLDHVRTVVNESMKLAPYYEVDITMVYTIAAYHDVGLCQGREYHHQVSAQMLQADKRLREWFTEEQISIMSQAVEDHRASNQHIPRSIYGKIVAEADRVIDPILILQRTIQYGLHHYPQLTPQEHYQRFIQHLHEKYATGGYLKLWIPQSSNAVKLEELRRIIANKQALSEWFEKLFQIENEKMENN